MKKDASLIFFILMAIFFGIAVSRSAKAEYISGDGTWCFGLHGEVTYDLDRCADNRDRAIQDQLRNYEFNLGYIDAIGNQNFWSELAAHRGYQGNITAINNSPSNANETSSGASSRSDPSLANSNSSSNYNTASDRVNVDTRVHQAQHNPDVNVVGP